MNDLLFACVLLLCILEVGGVCLLVFLREDYGHPFFEFLADLCFIAAGFLFSFGPLFIWGLGGGFVSDLVPLALVVLVLLACGKGLSRIRLGSKGKP